MAVWGEVSTVYMRWSLGGSCSGALWTMAVSWSRRSLGRHPATLFLHSACQAVSAWTGLPQVDLLESSWWWKRSALGADMRDPSPWEAEGKLYLLVSRPGRDPIGGAVGRATPRERRLGAPEHR